MKKSENEKQEKDEENRKRQSFSNSETSSYLLRNAPNKSTYGKWKRKKGPAPSRPVPQRRSIKSLPLNEIHRELDLIEIQLQGIEKQAVKLEQIIREKTETATGDLGIKAFLIIITFTSFTTFFRFLQKY